MPSTDPFGRLFTEADRYVDGFVERYRMLDSEHGERANLSWLTEAVGDIPSAELAPLFAAAIRRLAAEAL